MGWHLIESVALDKPRHGEPCNGCGVCCIAQVCDLGLELGDEINCKALIQNPDRTFSCGLVVNPYHFLPEDELVVWKFIDSKDGSGAGERRLKELNAEFLGAGRGCDSDDDAVAEYRAEALANYQLSLSLTVDHLV